MGLTDVLNGMRNGPRGGAPAGGSTGGMSPITMGLLALLAYKALKGSGIFGSEPAPQQPPQSQPAGRPAVPDNQAQGGSDWLDALGRLATGAGAGNILSGGLGELVKKLQQAGHGQAAQSWLGTGPNQPVASGDLEQALGRDTLDELSRRTGVSREHLLSELKDQLPTTVDTLTPDGRLPNEQEASRWA